MMTPQTVVLGATVAEWEQLFTGNFVKNLELDYQRAQAEKRAATGERPDKDLP
jgi:hypothetical protein